MPSIPFECFRSGKPATEASLASLSSSLLFWEVSIVSRYSIGTFCAAIHPIFASLSSYLQSQSNQASPGCRPLLSASRIGHFCPGCGKSALSALPWLCFVWQTRPHLRSCMRFLFVRPEFCPLRDLLTPKIRLSSDSASRRTPLPLAKPSRYRATSGLSP